MNLGERPVLLDEYAPRGKAIVIEGHEIVMHPIDWAELPHPIRWPVARLEAGIAVILAKANRRLDALATTLTTERTDS